MNKLAVLIISFYQRYISPYKGYRCAYGVLNNRGSCSNIVKEIIRTQGLLSGWGNIKAQFSACSNANDELKKRKKDDEQKKDKRGDPCTGCDCGSFIDCVPIRSCKKGPDSNCDLPCDCSF